MDQDPREDERRARRQARSARRDRQGSPAPSASRGRGRVLPVLAIAAVVAVLLAVVLTRGGDKQPSRAANPALATKPPGHAGRTPRRPATAPRGPLVRGEAARRMAVPILMYHVINRPKPGTPFPELWVPAEDFRAQMEALHGAGFQGVTLGQVIGAWDHGSPLPLHPVVVSFDDGYLSHATKAAPVLRRLGWPGVLNLELRNLGNDGLPLPRVRGLIREGWEITSHTVDHPDLTTLDAARLRSELVDSRAEIERRLGVKVRFFCYPAGRYNETVVAAVRAAGYSAATTVDPGYATPRGNRLELPRVRVNGGETAAQLLEALRQAKPTA